MTNNSPTPANRKRFPLAIAVIAGAVLIGLIILFAVQMKNAKQDMLVIGSNIPDFSVTTFTGETFQKSQLQGKVVLLNFWSSWCASCDEEGAALEEVWQEVKDDGEIIFIGVNYVDTEKDSLAFLEKYGITFPNGPDMGSRISRLFKVDAVPETYIIGRDGRLVAIQIGPFQSADEIRAALDLAK
ncbi:MAG: TlpA disulfide reductase family protein [Anaerolineaceae bacterium]|jgi:cytochrome c biogenesis protein CcmG/thiol:disulfide interchange protein DsbE